MKCSKVCEVCWAGPFYATPMPETMKEEKKKDGERRRRSATTAEEEEERVEGEDGKKRERASAGRLAIEGAVRERRNLDLGGVATPESRNSESGYQAAMPRVIGTDIRCNPKVR